jgi:threonine/homoserine/homoserine lactone efflux protein
MSLDGDFSLFTRGVALGFALAASPGPIFLLFVRRTLADGPATGLASGLGVATADAMYGVVAGLGLTAVTEVLVGQAGWIHLLGGAFLCWLGLRTAFARRDAAGTANTPKRGPAGAFASMLVLTLTNPMTILSFAAMFAGMGLAGPERGAASALWLVQGIATGSMLLWTALAMVLARARGWVTPGALLWFQRVSGIVIAGFGAAAFLHA